MLSNYIDMVYLEFYLYYSKIGLHLLRRIKIPDAPTLFPLPRTSQISRHTVPVDFDKLIEER